MGTRGRTSGASLEVATIGPGGIASVRRPEPPTELTGEQADEWQDVVNRLPADWFPRETFGLLAQFCRHRVRARRLAQLLDAMESSKEFDPKEYRDLLRDEAAQSDAIAKLATRMRISQQSTYDKTKAKPRGTTRKPWEIQE